MILYFENSRGQRRIVSEHDALNDCIHDIYNFCDEHNFKIYYYRTWFDDNGELWFDVGSHTEFFIVEGATINDLHEVSNEGQDN